MFLHEIVHIYVEESLYLLGDPSPEAVERYDVNKCVRLSALNAVGNAQSYCYHVASELDFSFRGDEYDDLLKQIFSANAATSRRNLDQGHRSANY